MLTPHKIISLTIDPFVFEAETKARNILDALDVAGYCIRQKNQYPHNTPVFEVCRDGEMRAM
jgi:hypothetical protein